MIALGVDIGGTKIEVQSFGPEWTVLSRLRIQTPQEYAGFIRAIAELVRVTLNGYGGIVPIGISSAGFNNLTTSAFIAANLPASGKPFLTDITEAVGQTVTLVNDARAFTQSEAVFGAAKDERTVVGVILGTGVGGGIVVDGHLRQGKHAIAGEFGHMPTPAHVVGKLDLPIVRCRCGRIGCIETLVSGPGLVRLCYALTGRKLDPAEIGELRQADESIAKVWRVWRSLVAETLYSVTLSVEPDVFVLGGGLSKITGIAEDLSDSLSSACFLPGVCAEVRLAQGGDASGARGAAFAAWQAQISEETGV